MTRNALDLIRGVPREKPKPRRRRKKIPHGTSNGYNNYGCRCKRCQKAWAQEQRRYKERHPEVRVKASERERVHYYEKRGVPVPNVVREICPSCGVAFIDINRHWRMNKPCWPTPNWGWDSIAHGTSEGAYTMCKKQPEGPCQPCKDAAAAARRKRGR